MSITSRPFGKTADGRAVTAYSIENSSGSRVTLLDLGCTIQSIVLSLGGKKLDVCLGYDDVAGYERNGGYLGAAIGRVANRIGGARFTLNGVDYPLYANDGKNTLHGGKAGFDKKVWAAALGENTVTFTALSPDGEEGFPGTLETKIVYRFDDSNALSIEYFAKSDADTVVNLTNHAYFNLEGHESGSVLDHMVTIHADAITPADAESIPHGELSDVSGTPFDLRKPARVGASIDDPSCAQLVMAKGYDHNFVLGRDKETKRAAVVTAPSSGVTMTVDTDKPGVQFYTGNYLEGQAGKDGARYPKRAGFCLETQFYPNAVNCPSYPSPVLKKGEEYRYTTVYTFSL